ncbi:MAG TPA: DUF5666 domain-containing protein [Albitalea sp.]
MLLAVLAVAGCGGGVDSGGTGAPVVSFSSGPISGFGSIFVNGVHYDDSGATVIDDEGVSHPRSALKLGMTVEVQAGPITTDAATQERRSVARTIQFGSAIEGPVEAVDAVGGTLTVLGQTVTVDADTVLEGLPADIVVLRQGDLVNIHALLDPGTGVYAATRIERAASLAQYKLRGVVSAFDTTTRTFRIGGATIRYSGQVPSLADGVLARVKLEKAQVNGAWPLIQAAMTGTAIPDRAEAEIEGFITDFTGLSSFKVNGTPVDASGAGVVFRKGTAGQLANGVRVEIEGRMVDGVLVADQVEIKRRGGGEDENFRLEGAIESLDAAQQSFVLRGITVIHDAGTRFVRGGAADLRVGAQVEVRGVLTANGTQLRANRIKFGRD